MTSVKLLRAVRCAHWVTDTRFHTTWLLASELTGLKSCWLIFSGVSCKRKCTRHTKRISTCWNIGKFRCGQSWTTPHTYRWRYWTVGTLSQCMR